VSCHRIEGGDLTSDGGLLLIRLADELLQLTKGFADCMEDWRNPFFITHTLADQVRQRSIKFAPATKMRTIAIIGAAISYSRRRAAGSRKKIRISTANPR